MRGSFHEENCAHACARSAVNTLLPLARCDPANKNRHSRLIPEYCTKVDVGNKTSDMQADLHHVSMPQLESNVRAAFRQRGVSVHPSLSIRSEIEADSHFVKEQGANGGDLMVCTLFSLD